jgi:class 3 adenylate cyclase
MVHDSDANHYYAEESADYVQLQEYSTTTGFSDTTELDALSSGTDDSQFDMLSVQGKGIIGLLEKLPLWFKLISMSSVLVLGYILLAIYAIYAQSVRLSTSVSTRNFMRTVNNVNNFMQVLSAERGLTTRFMCTEESIPIEQLYAARANTDAALKDSMNWLNLTFVNKTKLEVMRKNFTDWKGDQNAAYWGMTYFNEISELTMKNLGIASQPVISDRTIPVLLQTMQYVDSIYKSASMSIFFYYSDFSFYEADYDWYAYNYMRLNLLDTLNYAAPTDAVNKMSEMAKVEPIAWVNRFYELLNTDQYKKIRKDFNVSVLATNTLAYEKAATEIAAFTTAYFVKEKESETASASVLFGFVVAGIVVFTIAAFASNLVLSKSITGPWQRMNILQETAVRKFMPQGFLRLIKCKKIADVHLGVSTERDITMMRVEIVNFEIWTKEYDSTQVLSMLNKFLGQVCPLIRQSGGFVEKYNHNGFSAIFTSHRDAVRASDNIRQFLKASEELGVGWGELRVGIALHAARVLAGTVGEDERMDVSVISNETSLNDSLLRVNDKLGTTIVSSKRKEKVKHSRALGKTLDRQQNEVEVIEVYDSRDRVKKTTKKIFMQATSAYANKDYYTAMSLFKQVIGIDNTDNVCNRFITICDQAISHCEMLMGNMQPSDLLTIPQLRTMLEKQCAEEHSEENFELYQLIDQFKVLTSADERKKMAQQIYDDYCDMKGRYPVNVTDKTKTAIRNKLQDPNYVAQVDLLDDLQRQMAINMIDPAKRLMGTMEYKKECLKIIVADMKSLL